jgi:hypothetical protein
MTKHTYGEVQIDVFSDSCTGHARFVPHNKAVVESNHLTTRPPRYTRVISSGACTLVLRLRDCLRQELHRRQR